MILGSIESPLVTEVACVVKFSKPEERFLERNELGRLATISPNGMPHVVPVSYIYEAGNLLIATDYATKKYRNLLGNDRVAFVVDVYRPNRGILVQGRGKILETGSQFQEAYQLFYKKFSWVRADPWKEREAPFIRIEPTKKTSWGLNSK
jgi:nitroimidazol reductase NimA-like FMN-containing flavoprotein (pyridoxamine 5'-phosphate oxidase superfamily)